ncbi:MAG: hypothetical protein KF899_16490 [Parvibaculum sp.]|nr:hypothetical protein [Parvibaculum sp.]
MTGATKGEPLLAMGGVPPGNTGVDIGADIGADMGGAITGGIDGISNVMGGDWIV